MPIPSKPARGSSTKTHNMPMSDRFLLSHHKPANRLVERLPKRARERLLAASEPVHLSLRQVITEHGDSLDHVYFPTAGFISEVVPADRGHLEVALVGNEGMFGLPVAFGVRRSNVRAIVQGAGPAWRIDSRTFRSHFDEEPSLREEVGRYAYLAMGNLARNAVCGRFHVLEQRMARWLLMSADRAHSLTFPITHAFLASMLGVRRVGVTNAARSLQERGLIHYTRGEMVIRDREGLQQVACSCYRSSLDTYRSLFPQPTVR